MSPTTSLDSIGWTRRAVYDWFAAHPKAASDDALHDMRLLGIQRKALRSAVDRLCALGFLLQHKDLSGNGVPTRYSILDPPRPGGANVIPADG